MSIAQEKANLRQRMKGLVCPDWTPMTDAFLARPELERAGTVMLFCGVGREPDTLPLIRQLSDLGKTVVLPKCLPGRRMEARQVSDCSNLCPGAYGIPEPDETCPVIERERIDLILVPNLCCDRQGYRLGHGAGYYDRYLAGYTGVTVALCPEEWLQEAVPRDSFDLPVSLVLTQMKALRGANAPR